MSAEKTKKKGLWWKILLGILIGIVALYLIFTLLNVIGTAGNMSFAKEVEKVEYTAATQIAPTLDTDGYYAFTTDGEFKIMQLTDVHLGGGILSVEKDSLALNAIAKMVRAEQPHLIIVTGDITFPVPYASGTNNNRRSTELFIEFMQNLGVYWTITFGNHDQEIYSSANAEEIAAIYTEAAHPEDDGYCLFQNGPESVDGNGNTIIKIKNSAGLTTQALVLLDSHSYTADDPLGIKWLYENIVDNQLDWYETEINRISTANKALDANALTVKSLAFWHIPIAEYLTAYNAYVDNDYHASGTNYTYHFGSAWETGKIVFSGQNEDEVYERMYALGSTQGIFCGHDHDNNFSISYDSNPNDSLPAIRLTYGYSIDYLAYSGIMTRGYQRGCTVITVDSDSTYECVHKNLYTDYGSDDKGIENLTPPVNS